MKKLLFIYLLIFSFFIPCTLPSLSEENQPYVAVFLSPQGYTNDWPTKFHPDLLFTASTWNDFPVFLDLVAKNAKGRTIIIDISSHGEPVEGFLYISYQAYGYNMEYRSSIGYITNKIEEYLNPKQIKAVYLEACYAGICVEKTFSIKNFKENDLQIDHDYGNQIEPDRDGIISFPLYGTSNCANYNNTIFLQDHYNVKYEFNDLRQYINQKGLTKDDSRLEFLKYVWIILSSYGL